MSHSDIYVQLLYRMGIDDETISRSFIGPPRVGYRLYRGAGEMYPEPVAEVLSERHAAKLRASIGGYFFQPCPLCGQEFGGHEWLTADRGVFNDSGEELVATIPAQDGPENMGMGICPACTKAGRGYVNPLLMAKLDRIREEFLHSHPEFEEPK